jgi:molybdopterin-guanine dinucleotide biosynthesis protein A
MGQDKSQLVIGGETLAQRATRTLSAVCSKVSTVGGDRVENVPPIEDSIDLNKPNQKAAIIGVYAALTNSETEWTAILACDLPFVTPELFRLLFSRTQSVPETTNVIVPVQLDGRFQPLCALYRTQGCASPIRTAIRNGELKIVEILGQLEASTIDQDELTGLENAKNLFVNINTPEELKHAKELSDLAN